MIPLNSEDYLTTGLAYLSLVQTLLGNLDQALEASDRSLAHAEALGHPYSYAYALTFCQFMHQLRRESACVRKRSAELTSLSREQGYPLFLASARHLEGAAMVDEGNVADGLALSQSGTAEYVSLGISTYVPFAFGGVANALGKAGQLEAAIGTIGQALAMADKSGEQWIKADLLRQHGELLTMTGDKALAAKGELLIHEAISLAASQHAALWELRASISLAKLLLSKQRGEEARRILDPVLDKFVEGLNTPDVSEAKQIMAAA
jgi:predicted ATPase